MISEVAPRRAVVNCQTRGWICVLACVFTRLIIVSDCLRVSAPLARQFILLFTSLDKASKCVSVEGEENCRVSEYKTLVIGSCLEPGLRRSERQGLHKNYSKCRRLLWWERPWPFSCGGGEQTDTRNAVRGREGGWGGVTTLLAATGRQRQVLKVDSHFL